GGNHQALNAMMGDAQILYSHDRGGADLLVAGTGQDTNNELVGDAGTIQFGGIGGNDTLVSGMGNDEMWGDAFENAGTGGADQFVFAAHNGNDTIHDFQVGVDKIKLVGFRSDTQLPHTFRALQGLMQQT